MVYEKYIKKGDKIYGPYIYHSKRVDGKVVSEYKGPGDKYILGRGGLDYKKILIFGLGFLFLISMIYLLFFSSEGDRTNISGHAILDLDANYQNGKPLEGKLRLSLREGELIPVNSKLVFESDGGSYEYSLRELISEETVSGDFYVQNLNILGAGEGYGIPGQKKIYPKIYFVLNVLSNVEQNQKNVTEQPEQESESIQSEQQNVTEQPEQESESIQSEQPEAVETEITTPPITGGAIFNLFRITGRVVTEFEREIKGEVSAEKPFTYTLQEGERVELKPKSVVTESGKKISDDDISISISGNDVVVRTDYFETETGFGEEYLGNNTKDLVIDLSDLGLILSPGSLKVSLSDSDSGQEILSINTNLSGGKLNLNKTIEDTKPDDINQIKNETKNETNESFIPVFIPEPYELTEIEKEVLIQRFGNYSVQIKEAVKKRGFIIIKYELGSYWVENSYLSELDNETLNSFMEMDKNKFLKDIARSLLKEEEKPQEFVFN